ncbi:IS1595 family transposase [Pollutibacter soli]|uniref:IS1595 family transposase n=1 Tax=Pollutibacter soli TaxID=3034157 RepID=UPI0030132F10
MFNRISIRDFQKKFTTEDDCKKYLFDLKWGSGYHCRRCNHHLYYPGRTSFHMRCKSCDYDESVTAGTLFHKIKFPLLKAFGIIFFVCVRKKGMSTLELSKTFAIRQKTAWLFKRKLQMAMIDAGFTDWKNVSEQLNFEISDHPSSKSDIECAHHDGSILIARKKGSPITATCIIQKENNNTNITLEASRKLIYRFRKKVVTGNSEYVPLNKNNIIRSIGDIILSNLKNWLKGIHHHCSLRFLKGYLDEFFFRFNFRRQLKTIWHQILLRLISRPPYFYKPNEL